MGVIRDFLKYRGRRVVTCPETGTGAAVSVDALHAALTGDLRLSSCSRWPFSKCMELCVCEIAERPEDSLVRSIVTSWYEGKSCALCGRAIDPTTWQAAPPAVLRADGSTSEWSDVPAETLPEVFRSSWPLCWYCNNIEELERLHPDYLTRRPREASVPAKPLRSDAIY